RTGYGVTRVAVGDPKVADVVVLQTSEIQIVAKDVGATNVVIWGGGQIMASIDLHVGTPYSGIESAIQHVISVAKAHLGDNKEGIVNLLEVGGNQQVMIEVTVSEVNRTKGRAIASNWAANIEHDGKFFSAEALLDQ